MPTYVFECPNDKCPGKMNASRYRTEVFRWLSAANEPQACGYCSSSMTKVITGGTPTVLQGGTGAGRKGHLPR